MTDSAFSCPEASSDDLFAGTTQPIYAYEFDDPNPPRPFTDNDIPPPLAGHAGELVYVFQAPLEGGAISPDQFTPDQLALSTNMVSYWTNFATTGNPAAMASSTTLGEPSLWDGTATRVAIA